MTLTLGRLCFWNQGTSPPVARQFPDTLWNGQIDALVLRPDSNQHVLNLKAEVANISDGVKAGTFSGPCWGS